MKLNHSRRLPLAKLSLCVVVVAALAALCLAGLRYLPRWDAKSTDAEGNHHVTASREPVAYVHLAANDEEHFGLVGADGQVFRAAARQPKGLPELVGSSDASVGEQIPEADSALVAVNVAEVLTDELSRHERAEVMSIDARDPSAVVLLARDGVRIDWGGRSGGSEKASDVALFMSRHGWGTTITNVDVSAPAAPAYH